MGKRPKVRRDLFWQPAGEDEKYKFNSHVALISVADGEDCGFHTTTSIGDELYAYCGPEAENWWKANKRRIGKGLWSLRRRLHRSADGGGEDVERARPLTPKT